MDPGEHCRGQDKREVTPTVDAKDLRPMSATHQWGDGGPVLPTSSLTGIRRPS